MPQGGFQGCAPQEPALKWLCFTYPLPWLKQGHSDIDPAYNERMGDSFDIFLHGQL